LLDIGVVSLLESFWQAHYAVFKSGSLKITDPIKRRELASGELPDTFDDRFDQVSFSGGKAVARGEFFDPGIHADREQLVLSGWRVGCHLAKFPGLGKHLGISERSL